MPDWLAPARRRGIEWLDDASVPVDVRRRAMADVARSNALLGGTRAAVSAAMRAMGGLTGDVALLDVATGTGDVVPAISRAAHARNQRVFAIGVDLSPALVATARERVDGPVVADAMALPFADASVDVVIASQFLHHFERPDAVRLLRELHRVARHAVAISDLGRSRLAAGGFWFTSLALGFHPVTRHDGVVSVLRGFTVTDLRSMVLEATGADADVRRHPFWRLTAVWRRDATAAPRGYT